MKLIGKALDWANRTIYATDSADIWSIGCTTFLGGIIVNLLDEREVVLFVQLGECKLYKYSNQSKKCFEIQFPFDLNRLGRLGPSIEGGDTCIEGLQYGYCIEFICNSSWSELEFGDIVIAATDGLWKNLGYVHAHRFLGNRISPRHRH